METLLNFGLFVVGMFLGLLWFSFIVLPVVYGFPRALWWALHGRAMWRAPFLYLIPPIIWNAIFLAIAFVLVFYFESTAHFLMGSWGFAYGQFTGIGLSVLRCIFSRSAQNDLNADFLSFMRRFLIGDAAHSATEAESLREGVLMEAVVNDFGALMQEIKPLTFYDVTTLPHSKESIVEALLFMLSVTPDQQTRDHIMLGLFTLADFQPGAGDTPISHLPVDASELKRQMDAGEATAEEAAATIAAAATSVDEETLERLEAARTNDLERFRKLADLVKSKF